MTLFSADLMFLLYAALPRCRAESCKLSRLEHSSGEKRREKKKDGKKAKYTRPAVPRFKRSPRFTSAFANVFILSLSPLLFATRATRDHLRYLRILLKSGGPLAIPPASKSHLEGLRESICKTDTSSTSRAVSSMAKYSFDNGGPCERNILTAVTFHETTSLASSYTFSIDRVVEYTMRCLNKAKSAKKNADEDIFYSLKCTKERERISVNARN